MKIHMTWRYRPNTWKSIQRLPREYGIQYIFETFQKISHKDSDLEMNVMHPVDCRVHNYITIMTIEFTSESPVCCSWWRQQTWTPGRTTSLVSIPMGSWWLEPSLTSARTLQASGNCSLAWTAFCWCYLSGSEPPSSETTSWWQVSGVGVRGQGRDTVKHFVTDVAVKQDGNINTSDSLIYW